MLNSGSCLLLPEVLSTNGFYRCHTTTSSVPTSSRHCDGFPPMSPSWKLPRRLPRQYCKTCLCQRFAPADPEAIVRRSARTWVRWRTIRTMWATMLFASVFLLGVAVRRKTLHSDMGQPGCCTFGGAVVDCHVVVLNLLCHFLMNQRASVLVAANEIRLQTWLSVLAAAVNLLLSILFIQEVSCFMGLSSEPFAYILIMIEGL